MTSQQRLLRRKAEKRRELALVKELMKKVKLSNDAAAAAAAARGSQSDGPSCFLCSQEDSFTTERGELHLLIHHKYGVCENERLAQGLHHHFTERLYRPEMARYALSEEMALEHLEGLHLLPVDRARLRCHNAVVGDVWDPSPSFM
jgi:hypothetical protein